MTDERLKQVATETVDWAKELSEVWTGTTTGKVIDSQLEGLTLAIKEDNLNLVSVLVLELAQTCDYAEKEQE